MLPLAQTTATIREVLPVYSLDGMTLLIGGFFLFCLADPGRVRNRTQFWAVFVCLVGIVLLYALRLMLYNSATGQVATGVFIGLLQAGGLVLTVLYAGGLRVGELAEELAPRRRRLPPRRQARQADDRAAVGRTARAQGRPRPAAAGRHRPAEARRRHALAARVRRRA